MDLPDEVKKKRLAKKKEIEAKNPKRKAGLTVLKSGREFWFLSPTRQIWHSFKEAFADPKRRRVALENLCTSTTVEPTPQQLAEIFEVEPVLAETLSVPISKLGGQDDEAEMVDFTDA